MKINFALILAIIVAVGIVSLVFTFIQTTTERQKLTSELELKTIRNSEEFYSTYTKELEKADSVSLKKVADHGIARYGFLGVAIYVNSDTIKILDSTVLDFLPESSDYIAQAIAADSSMGNIISAKKKQVYQFIRLIGESDQPTKAMIFYSDASYIDNLIHSIWIRNFLRWFIQALLVALVTIVVIKWRIAAPINKVIEWVKMARSGNVEQLKQPPPSSFLEPLYKEISQIAKAMHEARAIAEEEARLRTTGEAIWTPERLKEEMRKLLENKMLVVVSNREPYMHIHSGKEIKYITPASGLITAMEPILKACGGLWIASGTGDADRETVDKNDKVQVPPEGAKYTLRRVWLTKEEEDHFYYGFSNEGLWPLCHIAHTRPVFRKEDWDYYKKVNEIYAKAVLEEIKNQEDPIILVQDYHFTLLPALIKKERPDARVAIFWHIPWPNPESFGICPWQREILGGMLGADLIGFHTQFHCNNFLETVSKSLESRIIWESFSVKIANHTTLVKPFPISIAFTLKDYDDKNVSTPNASELLKEHGISAKYVGIGVDRIDYTKGIVEKFLAVERFLEKNRSYQGKFTFVQIGAPSRTLLKSYADIVNAVEGEANRINWKFRSKNWKAILLLKRHHSHEEIIPFYQSADLCMVNSLHDGMNLVAKEFAASRVNNDGVLILSRFAGASQEMQGAMIVNPYDIEQTADAIKQALEMKLEDQQRRMKHMRELIVGHNIYAWASSLLRTIASI
jgi:trehalose-6-phosphate synthase